jgi:hypothetical protein
MLRRIFDGLLIALVAWFALARLDAGGMAIGIVLAAVLVFTGWRIAKLWRKYKRLVRELAAAEAARLSDDPAERERAERILRSRRMSEVAELSLWTGFVMGAAAIDGHGAMAHGGYDGIGADMGGGGFAGGDMGGGFGGFDGGGM